MKNKPFMRQILLLLAVSVSWLAVCAEECDEGWFGQSCQYKCHCTGNCTNNGDCTGDSTCELGWFGPQCQYVDLTYTASTASTPLWLTDGDDKLCNPSPYVQTVTISLNQSLPFSWMRISVNDSASVENIDVKFTSESEVIVECGNLRDAMVDSNTRDIHCYLNVTVKEVILSGSGVKSLCSAHISGGRNVALKQTTSQSSNYSEDNTTYDASRAVDGNTDGDFYSGKSCSCTNDPTATWTVEFFRPQRVNRYVLYNRNNLGERLKGFILTSFAEDDSQLSVFRYIEPGLPAQSVYTVIPDTQTLSISKVTIQGGPDVDRFLQLCEVEIFGDTACPERSYGRECDQDCHCSSNLTCFVSTGGCPSDCNPGWTGENCDEKCNPTSYGPQCRDTCSPNCLDQKCNSTTGVCNECPSGKMEDYCDIDCPPTTYGPRCISNCSQTCHNSVCYGHNGTCVECPAGKTGDQCDEACTDTTYGPRCNETCNTNCVDQKCNSTTGVCVNCPWGKTGDQCDQNCSSKTSYGPRCIYNCNHTCVNTECYGHNGTCVQCPAGITGDQCDQVCDATTYGTGCVNTCSTNCVDQKCNSTTGVCIDCPSGKEGDQCDTTCSDTTYGPRCVNTCNTNCVDQKCNSTTVTGVCIDCPSGQKGDHCDTACNATTYGPRCKDTCSTNCVNQTCKSSTGVCIDCPWGETGDLCDTECSDTTYGPRCVNTCSINCVYQKCDSTTGVCNECPWGKQRDQCDADCSSTTYGPRCIYNCNNTCVNNECYGHNGTCVQCPAGMMGDQCNQECSATTYGSRCVNNCGKECVNQTCDSKNGKCHECDWGKTGNFCKNECSHITYGPRCIYNCSSTCANSNCYGNNGTCTDCPSGMKGDQCDEGCGPKEYGPRCVNSCSTKCVDQKCDSETGVCIDCAWGKSGEQCDTDCNHTTYGPRCIYNCSHLCQNDECDGKNGTCVECPSGKTGDQCNLTCNSTQYGPRCIHQCNSTCVNNECDGENGTCIACPPGKDGDQCVQNCTLKTYGPRCIQQCSATCKDQECYGHNGTCILCPRGMRGDQCGEHCEPGTYGDSCNDNCNENCQDVYKCHHINGTCLTGCKDGYTKDLCDEPCDIGTYGGSCMSNCSQFCNMTGISEKRLCDNINGSCLFGCQAGYMGGLCDVAPDTGPDVPVGAVVGAIVGVVVVVAVVAAGVFMWRKRNAYDKQNKDTSTSASKTSTNGESSSFLATTTPQRDGNPYTDIVPLGEITQPNKEAKSDGGATKPKPPVKPKLSGKTNTRIAVSNLQVFVTTKSKEFFQEQFRNIPNNSTATTKVAHSEANKQKNRYKNICPYDHSRVNLLANAELKHGSYINASYLEGYKGEEKFIAAQGPTKFTLEDFVRMLWEQQTEKVVMLTNLIEEGKQKCERYWPEEDKMHCGEIKMVITTTDIFADYTIRRLQLSKKGSPVRLLTHFHFTSWPDKGVPTTPWGLVDFEQRVASYPTDKPIVVHCSAGVGRTGTFIALRNVMREAEDTGYVDCFATVQKLRHDRVNMVQTAEQYEFLHSAAQVAIICIGTTVTSTDIDSRISKLQTRSNTGQTYMEQEYQAICAVCPEEDGPSSEENQRESTGAVYENSSSMIKKAKDRLRNVPAKEYYRAILSCENNDVTDYINAVIVPSSKKLDQQILTQLPLPTTVTDFWRLVTQYKVALVVALDTDSYTEDSSIGEFMPLNIGETLTLPLFSVTSTTVQQGDGWEEQKMTVTSTGERKRDVPVFLKGTQQVTYLKYTKKDLNPQGLLALVQQIRAIHVGRESRIIYMCRNGAELSGLACVLTLLLDRLDNDLCLTVPLVVGAIKSIRPQVIPTLDQYQMLYQVLHLYNEANNVYSNFGESQRIGNDLFPPSQLPPNVNSRDSSQVYENIAL